MAKHKLYIKDNMIAMQEMLDSGIKVDMIYADPLYNADNKFFKAYDDNVQEWTEFMRPRLELAKNLLTEMGLIFLSINEDGLFDLKPLCDEIFGKKNKIALFAVKTANQTEGRNVIKNTEYLLAYAKTEQGHLYHDPKRQEARCTTSKESQSPNYVSIPAGVRVENVADGTYTDADIKKIGSNEDLELKKGPIIVKNHRLQSEIQLYGRWSNPTDVRNWQTNFKSVQRKRI
jgi:adenine-specific DNA-methyltransferase